jgi:hypothetical protein
MLTSKRETLKAGRRAVDSLGERTASKRVKIKDESCCDHWSDPLKHVNYSTELGPFEGWSRQEIGNLLGHTIISL